MIPLPNLVQAFVTKSLTLASPWNFYLQQFTQAPPNIADIIVPAPPSFNYTAKEPGSIYVTGGTISGLFLTRGLISINITGQKLIPVSIQDRITAFYTVAPTMQFLASYGQNTNQ